MKRFPHRLARHAARLLVTTSILAIAPALAPHGPVAAAQETAATPLHDALETARGYGTRSFIASVFENARLTPFRVDEVLATAHALRPDLTRDIDRAGEAALALNRATTRGLPPGADPRVDLASLSEQQRNFGYQLIGTDTAREAGFTGEGVVVGVIDTGIDQRPDGTIHPEFEGRLDSRSTSYLHWIDKGNFDPNDVAAFFNQGATDTNDVDGHGTHVSGIIGAALNGQGMVGVASGATILSVAAVPTGGYLTLPDGSLYLDNGKPVDNATLQVCGAASIAGNCQQLYQGSSITGAAMRYMAGISDVRVINGSFGPTPDAGAVSQDVSGDEFENDSLRQVIEAGQIFVVAAGNEYGFAPVASEQPSGLGLVPFISPGNAGVTNSAGAVIFDDGGADLDYSDLRPENLAAREEQTGEALGRLVVVVSVDANKQIAAYSNRCGVAAEWCIAAPGGDEDNGQRGIYSTYPTDGYEHEQGTSMAAPHVAGAVAVLIEAYPDFTPGQIVRLMFDTAEDLGAAGIDAIYGNGLLRLDLALAGPRGIRSNSTAIYVANIGSDTSWTWGFNSAGGMQKTGAGKLTVMKPVSFARDSSVDGGILSVNSVLTTPNLTVGTGGTLGGSGTVTGNVNVSGHLSPGNSPGTLSVSGDVTLADTATTTIEVDGTGTGSGAGRYDRIVVTGAGSTFTADGTLVPVLRGISAPATNSFVPSLGQLFAFVVTPNGKVAGSFDRLTQPSEGLLPGSRFDVIYAPQSLSLVATPQQYSDLSAFGVSQTTAARNVGGALDAVRPAAGTRPSAAEAGVFDTLYRAGAGSIAVNLDAAAGTLYTDLGQESVRAVGRFADTVARRQTELLVSETGGASGQGLRYWGRARGTTGDATDGDGGYDTKTSSLTVGADRQMESAVMGGAVSIEVADVDADHGGADLSTVQAALYLEREIGRASVGVRGGLAHVEWDAARFVFDETYRGDGGEIGGFVEAYAGTRIDTAFATLAPSLTLGYRATSRDGFEETGDFGLAVEDETFEEAHATAGVSAWRVFALNGTTVFAPRVSLAYRGDLEEISDSGTHRILGASFEAPGVEVGRHALLAGVGADLIFGERVTASVEYDAETRKNLLEQSLAARVSVRW